MQVKIYNGGSTGVILMDIELQYAGSSGIMKSPAQGSTVERKNNMDPPIWISLIALLVSYLTYRQGNYRGKHRKRKRYRRGKRQK